MQPWHVGVTGEANTFSRHCRGYVGPLIPPHQQQEASPRHLEKVPSLPGVPLPLSLTTDATQVSLQT